MLKDFMHIREKVFGTPVMQKTLIILLIMAVVASIWPSENNPETAETETPSYIEFGIASYYANLFQGRPTASGEIYYHHLPTAAHQTLPLGSRVLVTCMETKNSIEVTINDRGPFVGERIIDLSRSSFSAINDLRKGLIYVKIEVIE
ncbi:septal ring lytic transglycosylase RlpA family protein [Alkalitalea saponilacus]|uniref:Probable endolytic peptidoglycan transglycosylase RlpA n=1 Tax=Alkalitalea saponilacus TaxID=889453 RepID=A0A1T5H440_9BACT|nr:septal ring lytic transglycosylase RlpA family protein [Alkalitalea saponilacus]ASB50895.1 septal ring lytic transglycosylase RlpA family lipoprotein [Alkalitalea saponilacus]SKC15432.1 Rare lipoprotein A (RlpA)-like double-psi beta-barrel [Alkalitalea saponilacus]